MSHESVPSDPEINAIEAALKSLVPARGWIDRDRVMFRAGQASVRRSSLSGRAWGAIAASLGLIALGEAALLANRPSPRIVERVVIEPPVATVPDPIVAGAPASIPSGLPLSLGQTAYERLAGQVLRYGLDGLPASPTAGSPFSGPWPASSGQLLKEELDKFLDPGDPS